MEQTRVKEYMCVQGSWKEMAEGETSPVLIIEVRAYVSSIWGELEFSEPVPYNVCL